MSNSAVSGSPLGTEKVQEVERKPRQFLRRQRENVAQAGGRRGKIMDLAIAVERRRLPPWRFSRPPAWPLPRPWLDGPGMVLKEAMIVLDGTPGE